MTIRFRPLVACATILALLFTQLALAAMPCAGTTDAGPGVEQPMSGCEGMDPQSMPLCKQRCSQAAQSLDKPQLSTIAPASLLGFVSHVSPRPACTQVRVHAPLFLARATHLPAAPRNCCLRI